MKFHIDMFKASTGRKLTPIQRSIYNGVNAFYRFLIRGTLFAVIMFVFYLIYKFTLFLIEY